MISYCQAEFEDFDDFNLNKENYWEIRENKDIKGISVFTIKKNLWM